MPDLPTLTVNQAQVDVLLATFGDANGYKDWLKKAIVREVDKRKRVAARRAITTDMATDLPDFVDPVEEV